MSLRPNHRGPSAQSSSGRHNDRLAAVIANTDARLVLTIRDLLPKVQQTLRDHAEAQRLEILTTDDLDLSSPTEARMEAIRDGDLAFLQYTSGSTSTPNS